MSQPAPPASRTSLAPLLVAVLPLLLAATSWLFLPLAAHKRYLELADLLPDLLFLFGTPVLTPALAWLVGRGAQAAGWRARDMLGIAARLWPLAFGTWIGKLFVQLGHGGHGSEAFAALFYVVGLPALAIGAPLALLALARIRRRLRAP